MPSYSPSSLPAEARAEIAASLNERLADGLDLHGQIKVAHWNVKGPNFASLHLMFEQFATALAIHNDNVAERAVTLGGLAKGTARHVAASSRLPEYPQGTKEGQTHVKLLAERFGVYLEGVRKTRALAAQHSDEDTVGLLTDVVVEFEKFAWFLEASLS